MRLRIQKERASQASFQNLEMDLKLGAGGLADIEFATQFLQLKNQGPWQPHTRRALEALRQENQIKVQEVQILMEAYDQYRHFTSQLCLVCNQTIEKIHPGLPRLDEIARTLGYDRGQSLMESLWQTAQNVRTAYQSILGVS